MMRQATSLLSEAKQRLAPFDLELGIETENKREWIFEHEGRLLSRTLGTDGTASRGKSPSMVVVDEAAYVSDSIFTDVVEAFFSTHDDFTYILTSTPSGDAGYFYRKVAVDDSWHSPRWPTGICPLVDSEWLAERKRKLDSRTFRTEFLGEFIGSVVTASSTRRSSTNRCPRTSRQRAKGLSSALTLRERAMIEP